MRKMLAMFLVLVSVTMLAFTPQSSAAVIYAYNNKASGDFPAGVAPWATLTIQNHAPDQVKFTLQANLQDPDEFIRTLWLNLDPFVSGVSLVSVDTSGGSNVSSVNVSFNGFNAITGEKFDVEVDLPNPGSGRLMGTEWVSWILQGSGLTENHFLATSYNQGLFHTMIHVQGIDGQAGSGKITATAIPEPSAILLFATGLGVPLMSRLRRRA